MERQAAGAREPPRLAPPALDEEFAAEQVDPEIPVHLYPKVPRASRYRFRYCRYMQDPSPPGPPNATAPYIEDHTPATTTPPAGAGRTTGAIFTGPRTISRMTATHAAFPQCTPYSVRPLYPAIRGKTTTSTPPLMCAAPPCDYKRRRRASFRRAGSLASLSLRTLRRFRT